jgi:hypothetical protein
MKIGSYGSDELKCFYRVLEAAIAEARAKSLDLPVHEMTRRLFAAADRGERSAQRLRAAILGDASESTRLWTPSGGRLRYYSKRKAGRRYLSLVSSHLYAKRAAAW